MAFCTRYAKTLDEAFASLRIADDDSAAYTAASDHANTQASRGAAATVNLTNIGRPTLTGERVVGTSSDPESSAELSTILLALRKLREALLASHAARLSAEFDQRVHVFSVRVAVLAYHPESYHPALLHLLSTLSKTHPLVTSELSEMVTYLILDLACRQDDPAQAFAVYSRSRRAFGYNNRYFVRILRALGTNDWVLFWRVRRRVDGYARAVLYWKIPFLRKTCLKALARSYMGCDVAWILSCATGGEMTWDDLVRQEGIGWLREGSKVTIRKPKPTGSDVPKNNRRNAVQGEQK